jgi:hypothetical protein
MMEDEEARTNRKNTGIKRVPRGAESHDRIKTKKESEKTPPRKARKRAPMYSSTPGL